MSGVKHLIQMAYNVFTKYSTAFCIACALCRSVFQNITFPTNIQLQQDLHASPMSFDFICDLNSTQSDSKQYYLISVQMLAKLHKLVQHSE